MLEVEYRTPRLEAALRGDPLPAAIANLCEREVGLMRTALTELGEELSALLRPDGTRPAVRRVCRNEDVRDWEVGLDVFRIAGTRTRLRDVLTLSRDASEAALVREYIRLIIAQREANIRHIYGIVLADATKMGHTG